MKVSELKVGELYKIRSDRKTHVIVGVFLDIHVGHGYFEEHAKIRPRDHLVYLGGRAGCRWVIYRGKKLQVYPNAWRHIVPLDDDIS
jgi:hypothetical protein|tara:strand:- start:213 stop:473 length:261 start_codon:yes stop_codon:yes gene_type:complete